MNISNTKFTIYMMIFILIGAAVVGIPLLTQSKAYYDSKSELENKVSNLEKEKTELEQERLTLIGDFNTAMGDRNKLLTAIELAEGDQKNWEIGFCKDLPTGVPESC